MLRVLIKHTYDDHFQHEKADELVGHAAGEELGVWHALLGHGSNQHQSGAREAEEEKPVENKKIEEPTVQVKDPVVTIPEVEPQQITQASESVSEQEGSLPSSDDDPDVVRSEINDIRKSVVSMSVGQPDRTTTIVKEWLEQPEPTPPTKPEQESAEEPADSGDSEEKEK